MTNEYGRIHTDGSRSGGQPVVVTQKAHTMVLEVLAEWGLEPDTSTPQQLTVATTEALCRAIEQTEDLRQSQTDVLKKAINGLLDIISDYNLNSEQAGRAFAALHEIGTALAALEQNK
jgi:hypothetical protein